MGDSPNRPIPIGARQLEALVRLAEAHARMKLRNEVNIDDARIAINLVKGYLMQVGYDEETGSIDIDKASGMAPASARNKIGLVRTAIEDLEKRLGKMVPLDEISKELKGKVEESEVDETIGKLLKSGDLFRPKRGFVQRM
jgi:replicative DNA helicase Mcm